MNMDFTSLKNSLKDKLGNILDISDEKKKKIKKISVIFAGVFAAIYLAFLLILPNIIDLNKFTPMISKEVEKMSGFKFGAENLKLGTTLKFGVKLKADKISLNYKDDTPLFNLTKPEIEINLPTILIGHINLDNIKADTADAYLVFTKNKKYTVMEYVDNILKAAASQEPKQEEENKGAEFNFPIEIRNVNVKANKIALHLIDENVNKTYIAQLNNSSLLMKSLEGPLTIKTEGFIGIEDTDTKFVNINADFKTKLPKITAASETAPKKEEEEFELPDINFNPLKTLEDFNLRADINTKLDIKNIEDFKAKGDLNIQKFSLKLADIQLPDSYVNLNFKDRDINILSEVFVSKEEKIQTKSTVRTGKKSKLDLNLKTDKITIKSIKDLIGAVLSICCIENDIKNMAATGYIKGNFNLNTNFKTIKSDGELRLVDGSIAYPKAGLNLSQMRAFLDFSENALNIKDTSALVNGARFDIKGEIASNSDINLSIQSDPLKIKDLVNLAVEFKAVNKKDIADFEFTDGALKLLVNVIGDFKNIKPKADINLNNFKMFVKSAKMPIGIEDINIVARPKGKNDIDAEINVKNISASMPEPKLNFSAPSAKITADMSKIIIQPTSATLEGTKINVSGDVANYMTAPQLNIKINGNVHPNTVFAFIPKEFRKGVLYKGAMPYSALVSGTIENIKITGSLITDPANFISIIDIPSIRGAQNTLNLDMALKNDVLDLVEAAIKSNGTKLANVKGQIKNIYAKEPVLSGLNISLPNKTNIIIPPLANTSLDATGDITLSGGAFSPEITGNISITNLNYPDFGFTLEDLALNFNKTTLSAKAKGAKVAKSDFAGDANISLNFLKGITINSLNYNSGFIDTDALIALAEKAMSTMPAPAPSASSGSSAAPADLGVVIKGGGARIDKLKSGGLIVENITYDHTLLNNVYNLNNLNAVFAQGTAHGTCSYNVMNGKIAVDMQAENIALKDASKAFLGIELAKSGTLQGKAKLTLSGATFEEQMRTLNGTVSFDVKDGEYGENLSFGRFINAANVMGAGTFASSLSSITSKVNSVNTQEFKDITGLLTFSNGIANVANFKSQGPNMSLYSTGSYNILNNHANLKITGKVSSKVAGFLGTLGTDKIQSTVEKATASAEKAINKVADNLSTKYADNKGVQAGLAILGAIKNAQNGGNTGETAQSEQKTAGQIVTSIIKEKTNPLFGPIAAGDIANIPPLSTGETENTKNFQVAINGLITNPKSIKSLKFQSVPQNTNANTGAQ